MTMDKPSKCKNCQWYGKPYWSIINPCDNCPMENVETFTRWQDPTIEEYKKEIDRLNNVIDGLEKWLEEKQQEYEGIYDYYERSCYLFSKEILDKIKELKESKQ